MAMKRVTTVRLPYFGSSILVDAGNGMGGPPYYPVIQGTDALGTSLPYHPIPSHYTLTPNTSKTSKNIFKIYNHISRTLRLVYLLISGITIPCFSHKRVNIGHRQPQILPNSASLF